MSSRDGVRFCQPYNQNGWAGIVAALFRVIMTPAHQDLRFTSIAARR